jgi:hypothetical protein
MGNHGADLLKVIWFVNKTINPQVDRFLKEGIPSL